MEPRPSGMPPMSTTSLPSSSKLVAPSLPSIKAPILASDILREEIAPLAPAQRTLRALLLPLMLGFGLWGSASLLGFATPAPVEASTALITAAAAALAAFLPAPYALRAILALVAGTLPLLLGARGQGPLALLGAEGELRPGAGLILATLVPAALFFRSQYRAFAAARALLVLALALSAPAVFFLANGALAEGAPVLLRGSNAFALLALLTSLGGFLGPETTGACTAWGILILGAYAARVFAASWLGAGAAKGGASLPLSLATCLGEGLAAAVVSVALYQLLAALLARRARMADIHQIVGPSAEEEA
jgi:hypothetical protein